MKTFHDEALLGLDYDFGGLYAEAASVLPVFLLESVLVMSGWLYYLVALLAYYSNRNAVRWAREASNQASVTTLAAPRAAVRAGQAGTSGAR